MSIGTAQAETCNRQKEQNAVNVVGLQNYLLLVGLTCKSHDTYNRIIKKYKTSFDSNRRVLAKLKGSSKSADLYVSELVNFQSVYLVKGGKDASCKAGLQMMETILNSPDGASIEAVAEQYAKTLPLSMPDTITPCPSEAP
jgi:hypothetical protein